MVAQVDRRRAQAKVKRHLRLVVCFPLVLTAPTAPTLAFVVLPACRSLEYVNVEVGSGTEIYIFGPTLYFFLPACLFGPKHLAKASKASKQGEQERGVRHTTILPYCPDGPSYAGMFATTATAAAAHRPKSALIPHLHVGDDTPFMDTTTFVNGKVEQVSLCDLPRRKAEHGAEFCSRTPAGMQVCRYVVYTGCMATAIRHRGHRLVGGHGWVTPPHATQRRFVRARWSRPRTGQPTTLKWSQIIPTVSGLAHVSVSIGGRAKASLQEGLRWPRDKSRGAGRAAREWRCGGVGAI